MLRARTRDGGGAVLSHDGDDDDDSDDHIVCARTVNNIIVVITVAPRNHSAVYTLYHIGLCNELYRGVQSSSYVRT